MKPINFDINATYGLLPEVADAIAPYRDELLNPSSIHQGGQRARMLLEDARDSVRNLLDLSREDTVVFTSGATEANNTAILSSYWNYFSVGTLRSSITPSFVTTTIEHPCITEAARRLSDIGVDVRYVSPRSDGLFSSDDFTSQVDDHTKLVSMMLVNNETGYLLDVPLFSKAIKQKESRCLIHCDAVQAIGKLPVSLTQLGVDMISLSGHKIGALFGIGALCIKSDIGIDPLIIGGPQETRRRAGTENLLGIVSFGIASKIAKREQSNRQKEMSLYRDRIIAALKAVPESRINLAQLPHIGNTISVMIPGVQTGDIVVALDLQGIYVSSGSACASGKPEPSPVLQAFGFTAEEAASSFRISVGASYNEEQFTDALNRLVGTLRRISGVKL